jgi:hypothetical protein
VGKKNDERVVLFQSALHEQSDCPLRGIEVEVEIDVARFGQAIDDQRGITDAHAGILAEGQFALGALRGSGVSMTS